MFNQGRRQRRTGGNSYPLIFTKVIFVNRLKPMRKIGSIMRGVTSPTIFEFQPNAAFTLSGFDDQERNLTFVKTAFQVFIMINNSKDRLFLNRLKHISFLVSRLLLSLQAWTWAYKIICWISLNLGYQKNFSKGQLMLYRFFPLFACNFLLFSKV